MPAEINLVSATDIQPLLEHIPCLLSDRTASATKFASSVARRLVPDGGVAPSGIVLPGEAPPCRHFGAGRGAICVPPPSTELSEVDENDWDSLVTVAGLYVASLQLDEQVSGERFPAMSMYEIVQHELPDGAAKAMANCSDFATHAAGTAHDPSVHIRERPLQLAFVAPRASLSFRTP